MANFVSNIKYHNKHGYAIFAAIVFSFIVFLLSPYLSFFLSITLLMALGERAVDRAALCLAVNAIASGLYVFSSRELSGASDDVFRYYWTYLRYVDSSSIGDAIYRVNFFSDIIFWLGTKVFGNIAISEFLIFISTLQVAFCFYFVLVLSKNKFFQLTYSTLAFLVLFMGYYISTQLFKQFVSSLFVILAIQESRSSKFIFFGVLALLFHWSSAFLIPIFLIFKKFSLFMSIFLSAFGFLVLYFVFAKIFLSYFNYGSIHDFDVYRLASPVFILLSFIAFLLLCSRKLRRSRFWESWIGLFIFSYIGVIFFLLFLPLGTRVFLISTHIFLGMFLYQSVKNINVYGASLSTIVLIPFIVYFAINWSPWASDGELWHSHLWYLIYL